MMFLGPVILLVHLLGPFVASEYTAIVETSSGPVRGVIEERPGFGENSFANYKYAAFKGIRYAHAPRGRLRFKPAEPAEPSTELYTASAEAKECPQYDPKGNVIGDEDCLFLNVLTPVTNLGTEPKELKSVMVWIHGGNFVSGSGRTDLTNPQLLLERDVVFVSMNYRLGALGFLSLDHPDATGNQGLKDQNIALKWVQANIKKFGGDPGKVTIFGKGAGAASVGFHVLSEASKGLFHRAISMSGTPLSPVSFISQKEAVDRGKRFSKQVKRVRLPWKKLQSDLDVLYEPPFERLLKKARHIDEIAPFLPTVEDPNKATDLFLSEAPIVLYDSGKFNEVPHILGITRWDIFPHAELIKRIAESIIPQAFAYDVIGGGVSQASMLHRFGMDARYMGLIVDMETIQTAEHNLGKNDILFSNPIAETRRILAKNNDKHPVYYYRMDFSIESYSPVVDDKTNFYLKDSAYTRDRDCIFVTPENHVLSPNDPFRLATNKVATMWTNFAKHGNPTPAEINPNSGYLVWPDTKSVGEALRINDDIAIIPSSSMEKITTVEANFKSFSVFLYS